MSYELLSWGLRWRDAWVLRWAHIRERGWHLLFVHSLSVGICIVVAGTLAAPLAEPDEARYAEIPREMKEAGDWVVPRLQGQAYGDKPPLVFWASGAAYAIFGVEDWAARLPVVLAALLGLGVTWGLARSLYDADTATFAAVILLTSPLYYGMATILTLDMPLAMWTTMAMAAMWYGYEHRSVAAYRVAYAAAGFGVLTKGPVAAILIGVPAVAFFALVRDGKAARRALDPFGVGLFAVICLPWFIAIEHRVPGFLEQFVWHHHVERVVNPWHHREPFWFYAPVVLAGLFPWSLLWLASPPSWRVLLSRWRKLAPRELFLALFALTPILVFSLSSSKLIPYVLPALAPVAILLGSALQGFLRSKDFRFLERGGWLLTVVGGVTLLVGAALLIHEFHWRGPLIRPFLLGGGAVTLTLGFLAAQSARRSLGVRALVCIASCCLALLAVAQTARFVLAKNLRSLGLTARAALQDDGRLWSYNGYAPALDFYTQREATIIAAGDTSTLRTLFVGAPHDVLVVTSGDLEVVTRALASHRIQGQQAGRILITSGPEHTAPAGQQALP